MPKYIPKPDDLYNTKPCPICGTDILEEKAKVCGSMCQSMLDDWEADMEWFLMRDEEDGWI